MFKKTRKGTIQKYTGIWHIEDMEMWDADYFNMEVQAYIQIKPDGLGYFQFGLVSGQIDGEMINIDTQELFFFTWDGDDEGHPMSGSGWFIMKDQQTIEGRIKLHLGDSSRFLAQRAK